LASDDVDTAQALDRFLASSEQRAYRMAVIASGNRDEALDIVQDAMFKLVKSYAKRPEGEWPALFHRIVQNAITDWHRKQKVRRRWQQWFGHSEESEDNEDPLEQLPQVGKHHPEHKVGHELAMEKLDKVLNGLPARQQQAFLLRQWEGLDVANTAKTMGISEGSVKTHYSRAIHRLREQLEDHWI